MRRTDVSGQQHGTFPFCFTAHLIIVNTQRYKLSAWPCQCVRWSQLLQQCTGTEEEILVVFWNLQPLVFLNHSDAELNPIRCLLALVGVRRIVHVSSIRVN